MDLTRLDQVVREERAELAKYPEGHPGRGRTLYNLALALSHHYDVSGQTAYLEESIALSRAALVLCPEGHPDHPLSLGNLAIVCKHIPASTCIYPQIPAFARTYQNSFELACLIFFGFYGSDRFLGLLARTFLLNHRTHS